MMVRISALKMEALTIDHLPETLGIEGFLIRILSAADGRDLSN